MLPQDVTWPDLWSAGLLDRASLQAARAAGDAPEEWLRGRAETEADAPALVLAARCADQDAAGRARLSLTRVIDVARQCPDAATGSPFLVVEGSAPLRAPGALAIVGTRRLDGAGRRVAEALVDAICSALPIRVVSGGALGVDAIAQQAALRHGREMVVVLAGGLAHAGPAQHRAIYRQIVESGGLLVTERPVRAEPQQFEFVRRNRLIAWLADATLVVRAPAASGALFTARWASRIGRPVLAVPGDPADPLAAGCHGLLRRGAQICAEPGDVAAALGLGRPPTLPGLPDGVPPAMKPVPAVPAPEALPVVRGLSGEPSTPDVIARRSGTPVAHVMAALLEAELMGQVEQDGMGRWRPRPGFAAPDGPPMLRP